MLGGTLARVPGIDAIEAGACCWWEPEEMTTAKEEGMWLGRPEPASCSAAPP